jgi:Tol biopolymer transport system component
VVVMKFTKVYGIILIVIVLIAWFLCNPALQSLPTQVGTITAGFTSTLTGSTSAPAETPHASILFSINGPAAGIYKVDPDGLHMKQIIADGYAPGWSPDGSMIVFSAELAGQSHIFIAKPDGSEVSQVTRDSFSDDFPIWLPDGETIAFRSTDQKGLWWWRVARSDGATMSNLTSPSYDFFFQTLSWSRDGNWIASMSLTEQRTRNDGSSQIRIRRADGSGEFALTDNTWANINPAWSPDGARLAFLSELDGTYGKYSLYLIDRDGKGMQRLLDNNHFLDATTRLSWSPDGQFIVYNTSLPDNRINVIDTATGEVRELIDISAVLGTGNISGPPAWQP